MRSTRRLVTAALALALLSAPAAMVRAAEADPAAEQIEGFDQALIASMKLGDSAGVRGRFRRLEPAMQRAFDFATMTRFAVGPTWAKFSDGERRTLIEAFARLSTASFAHNFSDFSGERFEVDPRVDTRGVDKIVRTQLFPPSGAPVVLAYRMRATSGSWKVIDILLQGTISQMTIRRSDLAAAVATGDAKAIAGNLNAQADKILK